MKVKIRQNLITSHNSKMTDKIKVGFNHLHGKALISKTVEELQERLNPDLSVNKIASIHFEWQFHNDLFQVRQKVLGVTQREPIFEAYT